MAKTPSERYEAAGLLADEASRALGMGVATGNDAGAEPTRLRRVIPAIAIGVALLAGIVLSSVFRGDTPQGGGLDPQTSPAIPSPTPAPTFRTVERAVSPNEQRLLNYLPEEVRGDCLPLDRDEPVQGELAALVCRTADVEVLYELFPTRDEMDAAFQGRANSTQAPPGECATDRIAVTPYSVGGEPAGRVLCYTLERGSFSRDLPDQSHIEWTDENVLIYAHAVRNDLSDLTLYEWWLSSSGPVLSPGGATAAAFKDPPASLGPRLRDGSYLLEVSKGEAVRAGDPTLEGTYGVHIDGAAYEFAIDGAVYESGDIQLQKPTTVVFDPDFGACNSGAAGEGDAPSQPAEYEWSAAGDSLTWHLKGGGTCAGPQGGVERFPWTRAPAGLIAFETSGDIALMDAGGFVIQKLTSETHTAPNIAPVWSPDGARIAFAGASEEGLDLYVMNADGTNLTRLTDLAGDETLPAWSPDGDRIAFAFDDLGDPHFRTGIAVANADGSGTTDLVTRDNEQVYAPAWSPDGDRIAFHNVTQNEIYVMDADGGRVTGVQPDRATVLTLVGWAPDGLRLVFWGEAGGKQAFFSMGADGTDVREFADELPPDQPALAIDRSPDGLWNVVSEPWGAGNGDIYLIRADGSESFLISHFGSGATWRPVTGSEAA
jgi:TolB protein